MGYIALYRKYRPTTFADVVGQENVTSILKNQIITNKISHAYIFSGTRGTGKTSSAKIFARAINCENPQGGEPCNKCKSCLSILSGENTDVVEMDAASNNSVENIRQIRNEVMYASTTSKYKVYIIDEVHMLTTSAFNALLKTLEEPPENVVFILATTEQHKIPVTILSRCLRFDFLRISTSDIEKRLKYVLNEEKIEYEEEAIKYIAKLASGALRDSLSILDRCLTEDSEKLRTQKVKEIVGSVESEIITEIADSILNSDYNRVLEIVDEVINRGRDLRQLVYELTEEFLDRMIKSDSKNNFAYIIDELSKLDSEIKASINPTVIVKATLVKISHNKDNVIKTDVALNNTHSNVDLDKINALEQDVIKLKNYLNNQSRQRESVTNSGAYKGNIQSSSSSLSTFKNAEDFRKKLADKGKLKLFSSLSGATLKNDEQFIIITTNEFAAKVLATEKSEIAEILKNDYGIDKEVVIKYNKVSGMSKMEKLLKDSNTDYTDIE